MNASGAQIGYQPRPTVKGSDGIATPVDNFGGSLNANGTCVFNEKPELYYEWGTDVDSDVEAAAWAPGQTAPLPTRVAVREKTDIFGNATDWGCPVFQMTDSSGSGQPLVWTEPLSQCEGFYKIVDTLSSTEQGLKQGPDIAATVDQDPNVICCHLRREERLSCYAKTKAGQMAIQAAQKQMGTDLKVITKGMTPEEQSQIIDLKKQVKDAAKSCWETKYKKVQKYFQTRKINSCIKAVKNYFKNQTKQLTKVVADEAATDLTKEGGDVNLPTVGTANSPGNLPGKAVSMVVLGAKGGVRLATTLGHIAGAVEVLLSECASIATDFSNIEEIVKGISDQLCEATIGLVERQLTQCIRINFSADLSLPRFSIMTQCPINISLDLRVSPSGITCVGHVSGQQAVNVGVSGGNLGGQGGSGGMNAGNNSANYSGDNMYTFLAGATNGADAAPGIQQGLNAAESFLAGALFSGSSDCFRPAAVMNAQGQTETMDSQGNFTGSPSMSMPRQPGIDCAANLNPQVSLSSGQIHGTTYLPPAPMPQGGMGWSASPVVDTGFPSSVPAWASKVTRCDFYAMGRLQRTAYVFGEGGTALCQGDFLREGFEIMTSCYPNSYVPVEKSPIPEACMYRQGTPQPCLLNDLSGLDPNKLATQGPGTSGNGSGSGNTTPTSVVIAVGNSGQLIPQIDLQHSGTVMADGSVLTQATPLSGTLGNFAPMRRQADGVTFSAQGQQPNNLYAEAEQILTRGDVVDMATSQDGCARGYASHDYIGDELIARVYPLSTPITNPDGSQIFTGQCSDFSTTAADPSCCDPQVQNCTKPPFASMPICACDQGDRTTSLIPARDPANPTQILYEKNPDGTTSNRPVYACIDKNSQLMTGATRTCCNAKLNGEGDIGCGSPLGVGTNGPLPDITAQESKGAVQIRAQDADLQADGYLFTNEIQLPRCQDDAAMCVPENTDAAKKMKTAKPTPYNYLFMRPDSYVRALNGKVVQCCSSKWCNVCPQAYAGAYGLALKHVLPGVTPPTGLDGPYNIDGRPGMDQGITSDPFKSMQEYVDEQNFGQLDAEKNWNMKLFKEGWPFFNLVFAPSDGQAAPSRWLTGMGSWIGLMSQSTDHLNGYNKIWEVTLSYYGSAYNMDYYGKPCFRTGAPCAFPSITLNNNAPQIPVEMAKECADKARDEFSSWNQLRNAIQSGNLGGTGVESRALWDFVDGAGTFTAPHTLWGTGPRSPSEGGPDRNIAYGHSLKSLFSIWANEPPSRYLDSFTNPGWMWDHGWGYVYYFGAAERRIDTYTGQLTKGIMALKFGSNEWSTVPEPSIFPIDYLNEMKAKMTIGQEFEPIKLCSEAVPLCTDPKLEQYGAGLDSAGNGTGGVGADQGSPWGNDGDSDGTGADGSGGSGMGGNASNPCAGITDPAALAACQAGFNGNGGNNPPSSCEGITDPIAYLACLASNGFGDGSIPVECVGLTGDALMQCILNHFGFGGGGGLGVGGTPEGGIRGGAGGYGTMTNPFGPGGSGGTGGNGNGGPVRPFTGDGTGTVVPGRDDTTPATGGTISPPPTTTTGGGTTPAPVGTTGGGTTVQGSTASEGLF